MNNITAKYLCIRIQMPVFQKSFPAVNNDTFCRLLFQGLDKYRKLFLLQIPQSDFSDISSQIFMKFFRIIVIRRLYPQFRKTVMHHEHPADDNILS